jgi:hypothetical protein
MYSDSRTFIDMKNWNPLIGKVFYELNPKYKDQYRTVRVAWNAFSNSTYGQYSNWVTGTPPEGMEAASPILISQLNRVPQQSPF